ncbi:MAG: hypothetical protein N3E37_02545 [Candidatus Micrarchaeota archaeon]|nr:hypothetical protein [Candidatus Micrarchaeota archaeon]
MPERFSDTHTTSKRRRELSTVPRPVEQSSQAFQQILSLINELLKSSSELVKQRATHALAILEYMKNELRLNNEVLENIAKFIKAVSGKYSIRRDDFDSIYLMASAVVYLFNDVRVLKFRNVRDDSLNSQIADFFTGLFSGRNFNRAVVYARKIGLSISAYESMITSEVDRISSEIVSITQNRDRLRSLSSQLISSIRGESDVTFGQTILFNLVSAVDRSLITNSNNIDNRQLSFFRRDYGDSNAIVQVSLASFQVNSISLTNTRTFRAVKELDKQVEKIYQELSKLAKPIQDLIYQILSEFYKKMFNSEFKADSEQSKKSLLREILFVSVFDQRYRGFSRFLDYINSELSSDSVSFVPELNNSPRNSYWRFNVHESEDDRITRLVFGHRSFVSSGINQQLGILGSAIVALGKRIQDELAQKLQELSAKRQEVIRKINEDTTMSDETKKTALTNLEQITELSYTVIRSRISSMIDRAFNLSIDDQGNLQVNSDLSRFMQRVFDTSDLPLSLLFSKKPDEILAILSNGQRFRNFIGNFSVNGSITYSGALPSALAQQVDPSNHRVVYEQKVSEVKPDVSLNDREIILNQVPVSSQKIGPRNEPYYWFEYGRSLDPDKIGNIFGYCSYVEGKPLPGILIRINNDDYLISIQKNQNTDNNDYPYELLIYKNGELIRDITYKIPKSLIYNKVTNSYEIDMPTLTKILSMVLGHGNFQLMAQAAKEYLSFRIKKDELTKGVPLFIAEDSTVYCFLRLDESTKEMVLYDRNSPSRVIKLRADSSSIKDSSGNDLIDITIHRSELERNRVSEIVNISSKEVSPGLSSIHIRGYSSQAQINLELVDVSQHRLNLEIYRKADNKYYVKLNNQEIEITEAVKLSQDQSSIELDLQKIIEIIKKNINETMFNLEQFASVVILHQDTRVEKNYSEVQKTTKEVQIQPIFITKNMLNPSGQNS